MPKITLTSYGAAGQVTGSCHLLQIGSFPILIDCGFFQGSLENYLKNLENFNFDPRKIKAVILSHSHLDHCGRLPKLYAGGYQGPVYTSAPTAELATIVLADNYQIMAEKAVKTKQPLVYNLSDLAKLRNSWRTIAYYQSEKLDKNISFTLHNAGHILGSAIIEIKAGNKTIVFSGDMGAQDMPLVKNIDYLEQADHIIMESTYGDRPHQSTKEREQKLLAAVQRTTLKNSTLLISLFAIERTQDVLEVLNNFYEKHLDFRVPVFLDSPLAIAATKIYRRYKNLLNQKAQNELALDRDIFDFPHLHVSHQLADSKKINTVPPPKIILAGSGMAEGGRILHHLAHYAPEAKNNILFLGYQVPGTLGNRLTNGAFDFDYFGRLVPIKASVEQIDAFSAHADQNGLLDWLKNFKNKPAVWLNHGNQKTMETFQQTIQSALGFATQVIKPEEKIELN